MFARQTGKARLAARNCSNGPRIAACGARRLLSFLVGTFLPGTGFRCAVSRRRRLVDESKFRAIGWLHTIGRTRPFPHSVAARVVLHSAAAPVVIASKIRAPYFYRIDHAHLPVPPRFAVLLSLKHGPSMVGLLGHSAEPDPKGPRPRIRKQALGRPVLGQRRGCIKHY